MTWDHLQESLGDLVRVGALLILMPKPVLTFDK